MRKEIVDRFCRNCKYHIIISHWDNISCAVDTYGINLNFREISVPDFVVPKGCPYLLEIMLEEGLENA